ncbi:MAG TPA: hypothetical protein VHS13_05025 [Edaphobacter sp.]|nr:hypothetical protein [Edaphobacter sp.]
MRAICCCGVTLALAESLNRDDKFPASKAAQAGFSPGRDVVAKDLRLLVVPGQNLWDGIETTAALIAMP